MFDHKLIVLLVFFIFPYLIETGGIDWVYLKKKEFYSRQHNKKMLNQYFRLNDMSAEVSYENPDSIENYQTPG